MDSGTQRAMIESLEAELAGSRAEVEPLRRENAELKAVLTEVQKALDAALADVARYQELYEKGRPNCPERIAGLEQQLVLDGLLESLGIALPVVGNDAEKAHDAPPPDEPTGAGASDDEQPAAQPASSQLSPPAKNKPASGHGRRDLQLSNLPVETVVLDPPEVLAAGGVGYTLVGEEASSRVAFVPGRYVRLHLLRRTFRKMDAPAEDARADASSGPDDAAAGPDAVLVTAPIPSAVWPNVMADPSAIAHAIVSKYDDLLPLHRQEGITRRDGFTVPRSTLCGWFAPAQELLVRIVDAMFVEGKATAFCMATDATGAPVRTKHAPCDPWKVFVFVADQDHVVFRYSRTHDSAALATMLTGYRGFLLGDATSIYSPLVTAATIVLACCWAHVRRYFWRARESEPRRAMEAIAIIGRLFEIERACAELPAQAKTTRRAELAEPVLQLFDEWLDRERPRVDPRSPLQKAITYADNQREELRQFLIDGRLRIDNNVCEGLLRNLVLGLNNWQRFETETGLRWYTTFRSLIASCKLHDLCPQRYLECVLRLAPHWSQRRMLELSPKYWRATAASLSPVHRAIVAPPWSSAFDGFEAPKSATQPAAAPVARPAA